MFVYRMINTFKFNGFRSTDSIVRIIRIFENYLTVKFPYVLSDGIVLRLIVGLKEIIRINHVYTNTLGIRFIYSPITDLSIVLVLSLTDCHRLGPSHDFYGLCSVHRGRVYATVQVRRNLGFMGKS